MARKIMTKMLCLYFVLSCILIAVCFFIVASDFAIKAYFGEFRILPVLNIVQFGPKGTAEEQLENLETEMAFFARLDASGHGADDPLWRFINLSTTIVLCNILFYYFMHLLDVHFPHCIFRLLLIASGIALVLISVIRIYVHNICGNAEMIYRYPIAYISWRELFLPALVFALLTGIKKLLRKA